MTAYRKKLLRFGILAVLVLVLVGLLFFIDPAQIVERIGVRNGYLLAFLVSFFGGFSAGGSFTFITVLITLSAGGMNPLYLGLVSGTSLAIGDTIMFYLGARGRQLLHGKWKERVERLTQVFYKKVWLQKVMPFFVYLYMSFAPLPNDILLLFLATVKFPARKILPVIFLGDITFACLVTFFGASWFIG